MGFKAKDLGFKAKDLSSKAKAKNLSFKAKAKDLSTKAKAKELSFKAKAKDLTFYQGQRLYSKMGSIHTQMLPKALAAGAPPQTPNSNEERLRCLPVWYAELKVVLTLF